MDDARPKPMLLFNPGDDEDFVAYAQAGLANGVTTAAGLQQRLRRRYERAVVRSRGLSGEPHDVWYVYRDGRWVPPGGGGEDDDRPRGGRGRSASDG